eukprot:2315115-Amphidinium_carterae.1
MLTRGATYDNAMPLSWASLVGRLSSLSQSVIVLSYVEAFVLGGLSLRGQVMKDALQMPLDALSDIDFEVVSLSTEAWHTESLSIQTLVPKLKTSQCTKML